MRAFVILATLIAVAVARPDIGLQLQQQQGYSYQTPGSGGQSSGGNNYQSSGSGSSGSAQSFGGGSGSGQSFGGQQQSFGGGQQTVNRGGQNFGSSSGQSFGGSSGSGQSFGGSSGSGQSFGGQQQSFGGSSGQSFGGQQQSYSGASSGGAQLTQGQSQVIDLSGGSSGGGVIYKPVFKQGAPIITKHFYVHEAPEDEENVRVEEKIQEVRPQKHYKIIFIKAPSSGGGYNSNNYPIYPQNEEKTIVYVLSKKNEAQFENGEIPTPPPAVTSKPEVFFVKYKTKEEAESAVSKIQESFQDGGAGYNSPASFAESLGATTGGASSSSYQSGSLGSEDIRSGHSDDSQQQFGAVDSGFSSGGQNFGQSTGASSGSFQGPSGGQSFQSVSHQTFGGSGSGSGSGSGFSGGHNVIVPQRMIEIPVATSAFNSPQQDYLPPNGKK